jgi:hypothetical protein
VAPEGKASPAIKNTDSKWKVDSITLKDNKNILGDKVRASVEFGPGNQLLVFDSYNAINSTYTLVQDGCAPKFYGQTALAGDVSDPSRKNVVEGMRLVAGEDGNASGGATPEVKVVLAGRQMTLSVGGYTIEMSAK